MTYLLAISIGPVQEFISAARRTADLTAGSRLLVGCSQAAAKAVADGGGNLIFPASADTPAANKILAEITGGDPGRVASAAKKAAQEALSDEWRAAMSSLTAVPISADLAERQIQTFLEFYSAWVPLNGDYAAARKLVDRLLSARKALRDFEQPDSRAGVPKSGLDPSRDSVLAGRPNATWGASAARLIKAGEALDAISLLKRGAKHGDSVPSTSAMAVRSIDERLKKCTVEWTALDAARRAAPGDLDVGDALLSECGDVEEPLLGSIMHARKALLAAAGIGEPPAYYALLVADGDKMGERIDRADSSLAHRELSGALAAFADSGRKVISQHLGYPIYLGGDDVLALLPVTTAIKAAAALSEAFGHMLPGATLSAGIAIVHHAENLQTAVGYARAAEKLAKVARSSLAIALHTRGGAPVSCTQHWAADAAFHVGDWDSLITVFTDGLSRGLPYELKSLAGDFKEGKFDSTHMRAEADRIVDRKKDQADGSAAARDAMKAYIKRIENSADLAHLADRCVIARYLSRREFAEGGS